MADIAAHLEHAQQLCKLFPALLTRPSSADGVANDSAGCPDTYIGKVLACLSAIHELLLQSPNMPLTPRLSQHVRGLLDAAVIIGLYPHLEPGVNIPLGQRVSLSLQRLLYERSQEQITTSTDTFYATVHTLYVFATAGTVREDTCSGMQKTVTQVTIITRERCLTDLYAALFQLSFSPSAQAYKSSSTVDSSNSLDKLTKLHESIPPFKVLDALTTLLSAQANVPTWLCKACGRFLTMLLLRPQGVQLILEHRLSGVTHPSTSQLEAACRLLMSTPSSMDTADYLMLIVPQLVSLVQNGTRLYKSSTEPEKPLHIVSVVACYALGHIIVHYPHFSRQNVIDVLAEPVLRLNEPIECFIKSGQPNEIVTRNDDTMVISTEAEIHRCLSCLSAIFSGSDPTPVLIHSMSYVLPLLFELYVFTSISKSYMHRYLETLLVIFMKMAEVDVAAPIVEALLLSQRKQKTDLNNNEWEWRPRNGPAGGIYIELYRTEATEPSLFNIRQHPGSANASRDPSVVIALVVALLKKAGNEGLTASLFIALLETRRMLSDTESSQFSSKLLLVGQSIMCLMTEFGQAIMKQPAQLLSFVYGVLNVHRFINTSYPTGIKEEDSKEEEIYEELQLALTLLDTLLARIVSSFYPSGCLTREYRSHIVTGPEDIDRTSSRTIDGILLQLMKLRSTLETPDQNIIIDSTRSQQLHAQVQASIQDINMINMMYIALDAQKDGLATRVQYQSAQRLKQGLDDSKSDIIPVRVCGMVMLRGMVLKKDKLVLENIDKITDVFLAHLKDEDSFVYLNAAKGLSAMTDVLPEQTLPRLLILYSSTNLLDLDTRLRVGEALVQTVRRSGEMFSKYASNVVSTIFSAIRDAEPHIRASALSLLSVICEVCPLAALPQFNDISDIAISLLRFELRAEVRRGALTVIVFFFQSFSADLVHRVPSHALLNLYRALRRVSESDGDELCRGHARVALQILNEVMRGYLFPEL